MKIDVDYLESEQRVQLTFFVPEFQTEKDTTMGLTIVQTFSADFYLDPEIGTGDFQDIIDKAKEENIEKFYFFIDEEGLDAEIPEDG